jgi:hypothetical protein
VKTAGQRSIWQRGGLIVLAFGIMLLSLKACPADIQVRSTDAVVAGMTFHATDFF